MLALHVHVMRGTLARVLGSAVGARDFMGRPQEHFGLNAKPRPDRSVGFEKTALESLARLSDISLELKTAPNTAKTDCGTMNRMLLQSVPPPRNHDVQ